MEKYFKDVIEFLICTNIYGRNFLVAFKNGYSIVGSVGESDEKIIKTYERLGI